MREIKYLLKAQVHGWIILKYKELKRRVQNMENLFKATKSVAENIASESFKRMPFVTFFLYALISYFALSTIAELYFAFTGLGIDWIVYDDDPVYLLNSVYVELIIGILSMTNTISMMLILKSKRNGFWTIACSCTIALVILALNSQCFNIKYNSIGNLVLARNVIIPFILWAVLSLKNDNGKNQWQYLKN